MELHDLSLRAPKLMLIIEKTARRRNNLSHSPFTPARLSLHRFVTSPVCTASISPYTAIFGLYIRQSYWAMEETASPNVSPLPPLPSWWVD